MQNETAASRVWQPVKGRDETIRGKLVRLESEESGEMASSNKAVRVGKVRNQVK